MHSKGCKCSKEEFSVSFDRSIKISNRGVLTGFGIFVIITFFVEFILSIFIYKKTNVKKEITEKPDNFGRKEIIR